MPAISKTNTLLCEDSTNSWCGIYGATFNYATNDVVYTNDGIYRAKISSSGVTPVLTGNASWEVLAVNREYVAPPITSGDTRGKLWSWSFDPSNNTKYEKVSISPHTWVRFSGTLF